jgi:hypothetical protein
MCQPHPTLEKQELTRPFSQIIRLQADHDARRFEAQQLYSSLDTLLSLGVPSATTTASTVPLPPVDENEAEQVRSPFFLFLFSCLT